MKWFCLALLFFSAAFARGQPHKAAPIHSNNILVLIQPAIAGPDVDPHNYWQPQWILWPPELKEADGGQLLSVATGANWVGSPADFQFDPTRDGRAWKARNFGQMIRRGYFAEMGRKFGKVRTDLLVGRTGSASPNALRLALNGDSPIVRPYRVDDLQWPRGSLMVTEASSWDDVRQFVLSTSQRVLVVEYPPKPDTPWTRYWLMGHGWWVHGDELAGPGFAVAPRDPDMVVPGLIRARLLEKLITYPSSFPFEPVSLKNWPGANRFLDTYHEDGFWVGLFWIASVVTVLVWGVVLVANERSSQAFPALVSAVLLSPAFVDEAGLLGRHLGVEQWYVWIVVASFVILMASASLGALQRKVVPRAHPLLSTFALGLAMLCFVDPIWSFMSPLFVGRPHPVSPIAMAALFGYLCGSVACLRGCGRQWIWVARACCLLVFVAGIAAKAWWTHDLGATIAIPLMAWIVGEGRFRWPMLGALVFWPTSFVSLFSGGVVWAPLGLLNRATDSNGLNLAEYVDFLTSESLWIFILLAGSIAIFGYRFFFHQLRQLGRIDARRTALSYAAACSAALGVLHPMFLSTSLVLATGAMGALLFDAVQTM